MAKGQQKSNREAKKPKKEKPKTIAANPPGGKSQELQITKKK